MLDSTAPSHVAQTKIAISDDVERRRLVIKARLEESSLQLGSMRAGFCSVVPDPLLVKGFWVWMIFFERTPAQRLQRGKKP